MKNHLAVVETLVDADLQFIEEDGDMIYRITNSVYKKAILFAKTNSVMAEGKLHKLPSVDRLIGFLKGY